MENRQEKVHFYIELETTGEIWEILAPIDLSVHRLIKELVKRKPCLENSKDWLLCVYGSFHIGASLY